MTSHTVNPTDTAGNPTAATPPRPTRRVTDAPTRLFHWLFALCFVGAYLTADGERLRLLHVTLGYTLAGLLAFRLLYGLFGPRQVRLKALWGKVANAPHWARSVRAFVTRTPGAPKATPLLRQTENLAMGVATVALLLAVVPLTLSGYATYNDWGGEWLEDLHEATGEFMLLLVLAHLGLLLLVSGLRRKNQALPMLTGRIEGPGPDLVKRDHTWLAALMLATVLGYWAWEWQQAPQTPASNAAAHRADHRDHDD